MQTIEGVSSAPFNQGSMAAVGESVTTRSVNYPSGQTHGIQPCITGGGFSPPFSAPSHVSSQERLVEAVVGVVTAVIDLVVVALTRAKGGRETPTQNQHPAKPIGIPKPSNGGVGIKPPQPNTIGSTPNASAKALEVIQDEQGVATVRTGDGYAVRAAGRGTGWSITSPDGKTTQIAAGQEAHESDGGRWRFSGRGSFVFGANKVTVETKSQGSSPSVASRLTVYNGAERVTIVGLDGDRPTILALTSDGRQHDDGLSDGTSFYREGTMRGESWSIVENGKRKVMGAK
jgi:hypothetical protein